MNQIHDCFCDLVYMLCEGESLKITHLLKCTLHAVKIMARSLIIWKYQLYTSENNTID